MSEKADLVGIVLRGWAAFRWYIEQMVRQFLEYDCPARAGALTYTTLFAVVPMMTVMHVAREAT